MLKYLNMYFFFCFSSNTHEFFEIDLRFSNLDRNFVNKSKIMRIGSRNLSFKFQRIFNKLLYLRII